MKVSYEDEDVEALCKQSKVATKKLGAESAKKLQRRLSELHAVSVVSELAIGRPHPLEYDVIASKVDNALHFTMN